MSHSKPNTFKALFLAAALVSVTAPARAQTLTTIYTFTGAADSGGPKGTMIQGADGNFYGTTPTTVFKITPAGALTTLHTFSTSDGLGVFAALTLGNDGNFYGTATLSSPGAGTVFKITPAGAFTVLHTFAVTDGNGPWGGLALGADGNLYGTTISGGGFAGAGTIFKITPAGVFTNLYIFALAVGAAPQGGLALGPDHNLYGTTSIGGTNDHGTVFKITPGGTLTTLYNFSLADGSNPWGTLAVGGDGNFYGTTTLGGAFSQGTVFQITPAGTLKTLHSFNGADGQGPLDGLALGADGNFYGDAQTGGSGILFGTIFKITPGGVFTVLHNFVGTDGAFPYAGLTQGADGNLYGTTSGGGQDAVGTVFKLNPTGSSGASSISANGVVNAASFGVPVAPGSVVSIFGNFPIASPVPIGSFPIPTVISGVSIAFGNAPLAPLFFGSSGQINAQVPWELAGQSQTTASVSLSGSMGGQTGSLGGQIGPPQTVSLATYAPGIFVVNSQTGQGAILDLSYQLISASNPASVGSYVQLYCTGLGPVTNQPATGAPALGDPISATIATPTVTIGGVTVPSVLFSGLTPGDVGLYQINVQIPAGVTPGAAVPVIVSIGGAHSNTATMAVQ